MFPIFAESYWGMHPHSLGISFVRADGKRYRPFVNLAQAAGIPWYIFSDGEPDAITAVTNVVTAAGGAYPSPTVFVIPNNGDFEDYICKPEFKDILIEGVINLDAQNSQHRQALVAQWNNETDPIARLKVRLDQLKPNYGSAIARAFVSAPDTNLRIPPLIRKLLEKISQDLQIQRTRGNNA
jgi:putative ATP-dependent endonuclease of OLD family